MHIYTRIPPLVCQLPILLLLNVNYARVNAPATVCITYSRVCHSEINYGSELDASCLTCG
jgi:hypothetical protein